MNAKKKIILIAIFASLACPVYADNEDVHDFINDLKNNDAVNKTEEVGRKMAKDWENYEIDPAMLEKAKKTVEITKSPEFNKQVEKYQKKTLEAIERYVPAAQAKEGDVAEDVAGALLNADERLYVLVSTSMPKGTIKRYLADINKIGDPNVIMVLRGVPGGVKNQNLAGFRNMIVEQWGISDLDFTNIQIDPLIFRAYSIEAVPAIIYADGLKLVDIEQSEGWSENAKVKDAYIVRGDASLDYAVESIYQKTGNSRVLEILQKMRRGFYGN